MRTALTESRVRNLVGPCMVYDTVVPELCVRIRAGGGPRWLVVAQVNGRRHWVTLGPWPRLTVDIARRGAREALVKIAQGKDPVADRRSAIDRARNGAVPILTVLERRMSRLRERGRSPRHALEIERIAQSAHAAGVRDLADPGVSARAANWLEGLDISDLTRNRYRRHLVALGKEAMRWYPADVLGREPFLALGGEGAKLPAPPYFTPAECCALATDSSIANEETGGLLWAVLLYSGCRYREVAWLTWDRVDIARKTIAIIPPTEDERRQGAAVKRDKARSIAMHDELVALLASRVRGGFVFEDWWRSRNHVRYVEQFRAHLALPEVNIPLNGRRIHSLRHSHAIMAIACGVDSLHLRLSMGHAGPEMQAHYASAAMRWRGSLAGWNGRFRLRDEAEAARLAVG